MGKKTWDFDFVPPTSAESTETRKNNKIESSFVTVGALVSAVVTYSLSKAAYGCIKAAEKIKAAFRPVRINFSNAFRKKAKSAGLSLISAAEKVSSFGKNFAASVKEKGFFAALGCRITEICGSLKRNKQFFRTAVNYGVPIAAIAVLIGVVYNTASTSYGIAVEYNGQELGVVTAESVVTDAQKTIADRAVYYDTNNDEVLVTANLSIKPLNALDEVIDEVALADKMEEQLTVVNSAAEGTEQADETASEQETEEALIAAAADESEIDGKVRAFIVTVDGEQIAAVEKTDRITNFIEAQKNKYTGDDVISVDFDKDIEYSYEQYVSTFDVVDQQYVINRLTSIVSEPVYYEVENGDSPWNIARDNDMTVDELVNCVATFDGEQISDITQKCPVGTVIQLSAEVPYLQTLVTKNVTYTDTIDYEIVKTEDDNMYQGETAVDVEGVEGEAEFTALVTYKNDVPVSKQILSETIITEPVTKQVRVGTRETKTEVSTGSGGSGTYFWPVGGGYISAYFGDGRGHKGLDIAAPYGTPIYAAESGTVTRAGNKYDGYGNCVMISHADGNVTVYGHMSSVAISYGDYVVRGQLIGYVGSTGDSTGNHCHFEVRSGSYYNDPSDYVSQY